MDPCHLIFYTGQSALHIVPTLETLHEVASIGRQPTLAAIEETKMALQTGSFEHVRVHSRDVSRIFRDRD